MNLEAKSVLRNLGASLLLWIAIFVPGERVRISQRTREQGQTVFFFDESDRQLSEAPRGTIPPDRGMAGGLGMITGALVVVFRSDDHDRSKQRSAHLETYSAPLKERLERVAASRRAYGGLTGDIPGRTSFLVRDKTW